MSHALSPKNLCSPRAVASAIGWPTQRVRKLIADGEIEFVRMGNRIYTTEAAVLDYIERASFQPKAEENVETE